MAGRRVVTSINDKMVVGDPVKKYRFFFELCCRAKAWGMSVDNRKDVLFFVLSDVLLFHLRRE
jgi:hypothetical protein